MTESPVTAQQVREVFDRYRVRLATGRDAQFAHYLTLLERWNRTLSLTSIRERQRAILRHFAEPAMALPLLAGAGPRLLDVGSGAGIPGLPLKILEPERECLLVEANGKKATFLREVVEELGLERTRVLEGRLEDLIRNGELEGPIHLLTARAWTSGYGPMLGRVDRLMAPGGRAVLLVGEDTLRDLRRNLVSAGGPPESKEPHWARAARAGWEIRRVMTLPHLDHGYAVSLELPSD